MTLLSPATGYYAEVRDQLLSFGRVLRLQRGLLWSARGVAFGLLLDLLLVGWAWTREASGSLPPSLFLPAPVALGLLAGLGAALATRPSSQQLARRVDRAAHLEERALTALQLGAERADHPLALAQMRDAVEHLKRVDALETFPLRAPTRELAASLVVTLLVAAVFFAPNPWAARARTANPAANVAREQAQRVQRFAEALPAESPEIEQLRALLSQGARTIDARSGDPESALGALEDLEAQLRQMGMGDEQLASALAAVASALAGEAGTANLAAAINTGDLREVARAAGELGQRTQAMTPQERAQTSAALRDAANRAGRASPSLAAQLGDAADALQSGGSSGQGQQGGTSSPGQQAGSSGSSGADPRSQSGRSAQEVLNEMGGSANAAAERQRAQSQLEGSRNALERALNRSQSRSGSSQSGRSSSGQRSQAGSGEQSSGSGQAEDGSSGAGQQGSQGQADGSGDPQGGANGQGGQPGSGSQPGQSGYGTGSTGQFGGSGVTGLDTITRAEQDTSGNATPDQSTSNPYLGGASGGGASAAEEQVQPSYSNGPTQGGDSNAIPLGLRDLVKDYFSSLDQQNTR